MAECQFTIKNRMNKLRYIGVDGCKAGWFFVGIGPGDEWEFGLLETLKPLGEPSDGKSHYFVDIPIGLPSKYYPARACDKEARRLLGSPRQNSVFSTPCREVLSAKNYEDACRLNQQTIGKKISQQTWRIVPKIREMDDLLCSNPRARSFIHEVHPEICFWSLAGGVPMQFRKKSLSGYRERLAVLEKRFSKSQTIFNAAMGRYKRKDVARDDILDAMVAAVTGCLSGGNWTSLPETAQSDELDLPMEMVYLPAKL